MLMKPTVLVFAFVIGTVTLKEAAAFDQNTAPNLSPTRSLTFNQWREAGCFSAAIGTISSQILLESDEGGWQMGSPFWSDAMGQHLRPERVSLNRDTVNAAAAVNASWLGLRVTGVGKTGSRFTYHSYDYIYIRSTRLAALEVVRRANLPISTGRTGASYEITGLRDGTLKVSCYSNAGSAGNSD